MRARPKILIVDDRVENLIALEKVLYELDVDFIRAQTGNDALKLTLDHDFAIALVDVQMPEMDGFETVRLMREARATRNLPVIFVSAIYKDNYYQIKGIKTGAVDFIAKPIVPDILLGKVSVFLDLYERRRAMEQEIQRRMASEEALRVSQIELKAAHDNLEKKVMERTEALKKSQMQLIQTEKIAALGTLTAGIAHELNNPLMGMLNFAQYCKKHVGSGTGVYTVLEDLEREIKRCIEIVKNLLTFSRVDPGGGGRHNPVACSEIVERVRKLLAYRIEKENIAFIVSEKNGPPDISVHVGNMQQVFLNLIGNAVDAVKESPLKEIRVEIEGKADWVAVGIRDTGCGIPASDRVRIFDPFFTTKPVGKGNGMGLSVSRGIVEAHGGRLTCESEEGRGAVFVVSLPVEKTNEMKSEA